MSVDEEMIMLLQQADEWRSQGRPVNPEALCPDRPDLWPAVRDLTERVLRLDNLLGISQATTVQSTPLTENNAAINEALEALSAKDPTSAELVRLIYFEGLTVEQAAKILGITAKAATRDWSYARAWLFQQLRLGEPGA